VKSVISRTLCSSHGNDVIFPDIEDNVEKTTSVMTLWRPESGFLQDRIFPKDSYLQDLP
jgi:hypothetical protein